MTVDLMTKSLGPIKFIRFMEQAGLKNAKVLPDTDLGGCWRFCQLQYTVCHEPVAKDEDVVG